MRAFIVLVLMAIGADLAFSADVDVTVKVNTRTFFSDLYGQINSKGFLLGQVILVDTVRKRGFVIGRTKDATEVTSEVDDGSLLIRDNFELTLAPQYKSMEAEVRGKIRTETRLGFKNASVETISDSVKFSVSASVVDEIKRNPGFKIVVIFKTVTGQQITISTKNEIDGSGTLKIWPMGELRLNVKYESDADLTQKGRYIPLFFKSKPVLLEPSGSKFLLRQDYQEGRIDLNTIDFRQATVD